MTANVGRSGPDVRSDCRVELELRTSGGVEFHLVSKVAALYGRDIERQCRSMLAEWGVLHCRLSLYDAGALSFIIAARLECALRRSGLTPGPSTAPLRPTADYPSHRDRLRRSRLYLPGNEPKFFLNAGLHRPDVVILDLEDSVSPSEKDAARILVRNALLTVNFYGAERSVRINQGERGFDDLREMVPTRPHSILIPKVETAEQVEAVDRCIREIRSSSDKLASDNDDAKRDIFLVPIIESARGGLNAASIATASPHIVSLAIGLEDYTADIGARRSKDDRESDWLRSQVLNAARAAGIEPSDSVFSDIADDAGLFASAREARDRGFDGKGCIHPRQIGIIHRAFAPEPREVEQAQRIVEAFAAANRQGLGVVALGSKMIDPPVVKRAERILKIAEGGC
ncbi:MAG: citrate lyase ACP [Calditrichaeota bacterium]|nr:citrate lyase ACP [Calditrichota bacterium]